MPKTDKADKLLVVQAGYNVPLFGKWRKMRAKSGFTLVEILIVVIILGVLAAIVVPQFAGAGEDANLSSLRASLRRIRLQITLYMVHHNNTPPSMANFTSQMISTTDTAGNTSGSDHGPYLRSLPAEPFTGSNAISAGDDVGWNYNETTGNFWSPYDSNL